MNDISSAADSSDPFRHLPYLRDEIADPETSAYRSLDLERMDRRMAEAGNPEPNWRRTDEQREATRVEALAGRTASDLWVFAYGSLMWDPAFRFAEVRKALADGYHREFCLKSVFGRGSGERPGLMAGLDEGGRCHGLVFRIARADIEAETRILWKREMVMRGYVPTFIATATPQGPLEALAFVILRDIDNYLPDLTLEETAGMIAQARGIFGSNLAYLDNLATHFRAMDVADPDFFRLYERARELAGRAPQDA